MVDLDFSDMFVRMATTIHFGTDEKVYVEEDFGQIKAAIETADLGLAELRHIHHGPILVRVDSISYISAGPGEPFVEAV